MATRKYSSRRRSKGQSLPLIALMIVVLVAMVGLSVDVGNTFSEERQAVSAANAASLSAMNTVLRKSASTRNLQVYNSILNSLQANGIQITDDPNGTPSDGRLRLNATYIDAQGKPVGTILPDDGIIPPDVAYVQINLDGIVNTYFAQVVGRPDLPIAASAYAGQCALGDGVYPIAMQQDLLDANGFVENTSPDVNWRVISEAGSPYRGKTARRVFVHDGSTQPGQFGYLRWKADQGQLGKAATSAQELGASLAGFGNLSWGFDEADEPVIGNDPPTAGYPKQPGEINEGDWAWGTPGWKQGGSGDPLDEHIDLGTKMILPIYNLSVDSGANAKYRITGFGSFVILGREGKNDDLPGQGKKYYDVVYIGPATRQTTACQFSPVPPNDADCCELWGEVSLLPQYQILPKAFQPVQYVVVLDQSGSMSANFNGQCDSDSSKNPKPPKRNFPDQPSAFWQCANGPLYDTNGDGVGDTAVTDRVTGTGSTYYWKAADERRIAVAKQALETLISLTNMPGNTGYNSAYPDDQMALIWFTDTVNRSGNAETFNGKYFSSDPAALTAAMLNRTTSSKKDIYLTEGGTNGAAGLYRAFTVLNGVSKEVVHQASGKKYFYKQVVLFITDGVSNQFFHESQSNLRVRQSDSSTYPNGSPCRALGGLVIEDAECQTTTVGGIYTTTVSGVKTGLERPVTQAVQVSQNYLQKAGYLVFVIALSDLPATGLAGGVPSFPSYYYAIPRLIKNPDGTTNADTVVKTINEKVEQPPCEPGKDTTVTGKVTASQFSPVVLKNGETMTYPNVGIVTVKNTTTGVSYPAFIKADSEGRLTYRFDKVPPGIYTMTATVYYKHPLEPTGVVRAYSDFFNGTDNEPSTSVEVKSGARSGSFLPSTQKNISMRLRGDVCAGAGEGGN